jgi:hypothetical protein
LKSQQQVRAQIARAQNLPSQVAEFALAAGTGWLSGNRRRSFNLAGEYAPDTCYWAAFKKIMAYLILSLH